MVRNNYLPQLQDVNGFEFEKWWQAGSMRITGWGQKGTHTPMLWDRTGLTGHRDVAIDDYYSLRADQHPQIKQSSPAPPDGLGLDLRSRV